MTLPSRRWSPGRSSYTPGIFNITWDPGGPGRPPWRTLEHTRVHTTRAKQLAMYPVFLSGLQMAADVPENYEGQAGLEFLERVPTTWDDTKVRQRPDRRLHHRGPKERSGLVRRQHDRRAGADAVGPAAGSSIGARCTSPTSTATLPPRTSRPTRTRCRSRGWCVDDNTAGGYHGRRGRPGGPAHAGHQQSDVGTLPRCGSGTPLCESGDRGASWRRRRLELSRTSSRRPPAGSAR